MAAPTPDPHAGSPQTTPPSGESLSLSLVAILTKISEKLGSLEAMSLANRAAMIDRTDMIRREVYQTFEYLREEMVGRFERDEAWMKDLDDRLREHGQGNRDGATGILGLLATAMKLVKSASLLKYAATALVLLLTAVMHLLPAETHAFLKAVLKWLAWLIALKGG